MLFHVTCPSCATAFDLDTADGVQRVCAHCGGSFSVRPHEVRKGRGVYCSAACSALGRSVPIHVRFWSRVFQADAPAACWLYTGQRDTAGYGRFRVSSNPKRHRLAHRVAWELANGPIPAGLSVCHRCDNPPCVRPDHLFLGTTADNMRDKVRKGRRAKGERAGPGGLSAAQVLEIRRLRSDGCPIPVLARRFGVGTSTIGRIVRGESWKHV